VVSDPIPVKFVIRPSVNKTISLGINAYIVVIDLLAAMCVIKLSVTGAIL
jgi:hypothetical protein